MLTKHPDEDCDVEGGCRKVDGVFYFGPPAVLSALWYLIKWTSGLRTKGGVSGRDLGCTRRHDGYITQKTASRAAIATMSAHETTPGH